jgi:hypothetical protein
MMPAKKQSRAHNLKKPSRPINPAEKGARAFHGQRRFTFTPATQTVGILDLRKIPTSGDLLAATGRRHIP